MIKSLINYFIIGGLLYGGHYFLGIYFPEYPLSDYGGLSQAVLFGLFVSTHIIGVLISKKTEVLPGQAFLGFSVVKFIFAGLFILLLKKLGDVPVSKHFILVFMLSYFAYLTLDVVAMIKVVKEGEV